LNVSITDHVTVSQNPFLYRSSLSALSSITHTFVVNKCDTIRRNHRRTCQCLRDRCTRVSGSILFEKN